ncbi:MAG: DUF4190 domain-containing protein [Verrucomicrobiales bacterium]|nr:DUF4190 domain-containing protein [Verrucomicrobiales bacterium]
MSEENQTPPPLPPLTSYSPKPMGDDAGMRMLLPVGRSGWAIAAGYLGLFSFILIGAPFALITGIIAIFDIKKSQKTDRPKHGMGRAIFGIVSGAGVMLLTAFFIWQASR